MEFTKDMMFHIKYEQDKNLIKINKEASSKHGFWKAVKKHKFFTCMCLAGIILISADIVLINDFVNLLKQY